MKKAIGIEVTADEIRLCTLHRGRVVDRHILPVTDDILRISGKRENILDPVTLRKEIKKVLMSLAANGSDAALALPDRCGRILTVEVDKKLITRSETTEYLKWQIKDQLPLPGAAMQLSYHYAGYNRENSQHIYDITAASSQIVQEYEKLLQATGLTPRLVDLRTSCLNANFSGQLNTQPALVVYLDSDTLNIQIFDVHKRKLCHSVQIAEMDLESLLTTIERTLIACPETAENMGDIPVYFHSCHRHHLEWQVKLNQFFSGKIIILKSPAPLLNKTDRNISVAGAMARRL